MSAGTASITLLHLYDDLLNLYGENGNVKALAHTLRRAGLQVKVQHCRIGDSPDFEQADLVYMGCGSEPKQLLALRHLAGLRTPLQAYLARGGLMLACGNAADLLGSEIIEADGSSLQALGIFDYQAQRLDEREVSEVLFSFAARPLIGFQNRGSYIQFPSSDAMPLAVAAPAAASVAVPADVPADARPADSGASGVLADAPAAVPAAVPAAASVAVPVAVPAAASVAVPAAVPAAADSDSDASALQPLFQVQKGFTTGFVPPLPGEGFIIKGFIATTVLGLLPRNPAFLAWLAEALADSNPLVRPKAAIPDSAYQRFGLQLDIQANKEFLARHHGIFCPE
ncbi:MAG: hypothetical protein FWF71_03250 [Actinomycetia bacterium]|nr:hypothetical protein [Actinomycetes bacterium]